MLSSREQSIAPDSGQTRFDGVSAEPEAEPCDEHGALDLISSELIIFSSSPLIGDVLLLTKGNLCLRIIRRLKLVCIADMLQPFKCDACYFPFSR